MFAKPLLYATCFLEALLGIATAANVRVRLVGTIQILLVVGFTLIITLAMPEYWLDPFGSITKNVPLVAATAVMIGLSRWTR